MRVYLPANPPPAPDAPLVLFLHGYQAISEGYYAEWLTHLARKGNIIVAPVYMDRWTLPHRFATNARVGLKRALASLEERGVGFSRDHVVYVGHSAGGTLAANLAVWAGRGEMPVNPRAIISAAPGRCLNCRQLEDPGIPLEDFTQIPANIRLVAFTYDDDTAVGDTLAEALIQQAPVPTEQRALYLVHSDSYGYPELHAQHRSPAARDTSEGDFSTDALDFFGTWKVTDAMIACISDGSLCDVALGTGEGALEMGRWGDGMAVRPMELR